MSFIDKMFDKFLEAMKLQDDEPDTVIESVAHFTTLGRYDHSLVGLSVRTDLMFYDERERPDYCLQFNLMAPGTEDEFLRHIKSATANECTKLKNYLLAYDTSSLGLHGVAVYYDHTVLKFITVDNPQAEYAYTVEHGPGIAFTIANPVESAGLFDQRCGTYDCLKVTVSDAGELIIRRHEGTDIVYEEIAYPCDFLAKPDGVQPAYFLIDTISRDRIVTH